MQKKLQKRFIPNPDSAKFRNQIGECGEVSYKEADGTDIGFQRFIVLQKNIVLVENQTDQKQFELVMDRVLVRQVGINNYKALI